MFTCCDVLVILSSDAFRFRPELRNFGFVPVIRIPEYEGLVTSFVMPKNNRNDRNEIKVSVSVPVPARFRTRDRKEFLQNLEPSPRCRSDCISFIGHDGLWCIFMMMHWWCIIMWWGCIVWLVLLLWSYIPCVCVCKQKFSRSNYVLSPSPSWWFQ